MSTRSAGRAADRPPRGTVRVDGGHRLHVVEWGAPDGIPVVALHGGPGGASSPAQCQPFDPARHRVVMIDQRGCGRSRPRGRLLGNRTAALVRDIETVRRRLGIVRWAVFGGSWGAALALAYAGTHPEAVTRVLLRGSFLSSGREIDGLLLRSRQRAPQAWKRLYRASGADRAAGLREALARRLRNPRSAAARQVAAAYRDLEMQLMMRAARTVPRRTRRPRERGWRLLVARYAVQVHYLRRRCWLGLPALLGRARVLAEAGIAGDAVHGRRDPLCPPANVARLQAVWPGLRGQLVDAGHLGHEPAIRRALAATVAAWPAGG